MSIEHPLSSRLDASDQKTRTSSFIQPVIQFASLGFVLSLFPFLGSCYLLSDLFANAKMHACMLFVSFCLYFTVNLEN